ncbi:MAG: D-arabinono-1,4-lactone oxidase [Actinomycetes bacterium]
MARSRRISNWDRTLAWSPNEVLTPRSTVEAAAAVADAAKRGERIKVIGSALSWSDIAGIPDKVMILDKMATITVDASAQRVRVQAGARLKDVNDELARHGQSFENFGSIIMQTAGGYTGTGTHGTGSKIQILSASIESLELIDGLGHIHRLDADHEPDLFSAARVHLGCLGIVTEITFRTVEAFNLEERLELIDFDTALSRLDDYVDNNDYCKLWWLPYSNKLQVYRFNKTDKAPSRRSVQENFDASGLSGVTFGRLLQYTRLRPESISWLMPAIERSTFKPHARIDRSDKIIKYAGAIPRHQETEYSIPRVDAAEAIAKMRELVLAGDGYKVNFPQEIRFVAADDIPMSPAYGRDSCYLGAYIASLRWAPSYWLDFEALMAQYSGRPHWGKSFNRTASELRSLYPCYDDFNDLRLRSDPRGVFRNRFIDRVFPEATG